jgi:hypothetical protein
MVKLAVPAAEQPWGHTTGPPVASLVPCYEARLPADLFSKQNFGNSFARLYLSLSGSAGAQEHCTKWTIVISLWQLRISSCGQKKLSKAI